MNAHADEHGSGARFDALYANVKRAHPALTPGEFKTALRKLDADGHLALTGWTESTDGVPDRGLDLWHHGGDAARDAEDKLYYHATPGGWHGATPKTADPGASAPTAAVQSEAAPAAPSAPPPGDTPPVPQPPPKKPRAARKPKTVVPEAKLATDPGADKAALQSLAAAAPSDSARETILDAEHNVPGGDSQRNYAPAERRRYTVERLAAAWRDAHDRGDKESADYAAGALKQFGAHLHGPEVGESTEFDGRRYDSEHSGASGPVRVLRRPVVLRYPDGGEHVAVKGLVGEVGG